MSIEEKYKKLSQIDHILIRPGMYIGSTELNESNMFIYDDNKIIEKFIKFIPGLYKIFDELITNVYDQSTRDETMNIVKVKFDKINNKIIVFNNGKGIDVVMHPKEKIYVPELIFGILLTSTNFNDENDEHITGGIHGMGVKLTSIFSSEFKVEIGDPINKKKFKQIYKNNLSIKSNPNIKPYNKNDGYVKITFQPDLKYFKINELSDDFICLLKRRVYDLAMLLGKKIKIYIDNTRIFSNTLLKYVDLYTTNEKLYCECDNDIKKRWNIIITQSNGNYKQISFVNGINTYNGGKHIEYITSKIINLLKEKIRSKYKEIDLRDQLIKDQINLFIVCTIINPSFNSQTKEELITPSNKFECEIKRNNIFIKKLFNILNIDELVQMHIKMMETNILNKLVPKKKVLKGIEKLYDAYLAGTKKSQQCTLILTEGDSAKAMAISGLSVLENAKDFYGVFPLKGKLLNVREATKKQIVNNDEFVNLQKIIGLDVNKIYTEKNLHELRYGNIILMMDADVDGSHIKGLFINMLEYFWPSLLKINGFLKIFITPIIKVSLNNKIIKFYTINDYNKWKKKTENYYKYNVKYYKGLGTNTNDEAKEYFKNLDKHLINMIWNSNSSESINLAFAKELSDERKKWLKNYNKNSYIEYTKKELTYYNFINKELIHFSNYDNDRSIPSMIDGLKPSQRKVLYSAFKKNLKDDIKVAQFVGYISEVTSYHHGEISLSKTIISMAQNFVGSNNINILIPSGQFGTRLLGGKDHASPRYIYTRLKNYTRLIYHPDDDNLLEYLDDDGFLIEPIYYIPIIPMILINGCEGIGTGYSTYISKFNPIEIIDILLNKLKNNDIKFDLKPWYKNYTGTIKKIKGSNIYESKGLYKINGDILIITELPIGIWTENYKMFLENTIQNDKLKGIISKIKNNSNESNVEFIIKFKKIPQDINIEKIFALNTRINLENMYLHDKYGKIKKYNTPNNIINEFYNIRLPYYQKRKDYLLKKLQDEIKLLELKLKFINLVIDNDKIFKMSETNIVKFIEKYKIPYDMLSMPFNSFTKEKVLELKELIDNKYNQFNKISNITIENMWIDDLLELKKKIEL